MNFDITSVLLFINDILLANESSPSQPPRISEIFKTGIINAFIDNWKYFSFLFVAFIIVLFLKSLGKKLDFYAYLRHKDKEKKWKEEFEEKKRQKELKKIIKDTAPHWTPEILQSLDSKAFTKLIIEYFAIKGFLIEYPTSIDENTVDVFFLHQYEDNIPFMIVKCRAIGGDLVSLATVKSLYDLSRQYGLKNLALVTTGGFVYNDVFQNRKEFNLIGAQQLISMLTALPLDEQTYLFANMMINKN